MLSGPYGDLALSPLSLFPGLCFQCVCFASRQVTDFTFRSGFGPQHTVPSFRPQVASASVHCRQVSVRTPASACAQSQLFLRQPPHAFLLALGSTFSHSALFCLPYCSWLPPFLATFPTMRRQRLEVISGNDITLPPDQVFSGGPLDCLYCYACS